MSSLPNSYMRYLRGASVTSTNDFVLLVDRYNHGTPCGRAWGVFVDLDCAACGYKWDGVAIVGTRGKKCPNCGQYYPNFMWAGNDTCDGAWLEPIGWKFAKISSN